MLIPFTQYILPNGHKIKTGWESTTHEQEIKAQALLDAGAVFECEVLSNEEVSFTCEIQNNDGEMSTLAHEICGNEKIDVIDSVSRLIERAHNNLLVGIIE